MLLETFEALPMLLLREFKLPDSSENNTLEAAKVPFSRAA
jgi:hypothetical protein